ncbi:MAG: SPOR domain-containing protein [Bacteroidota bacterium]
MTIFIETQELLYQNDCVIVPGFGAFILKSHSAYIEGSVFYPPKKTVSFNSMLNENDGLLVKHVSRKRDISYKDSLRFIKEEVDAFQTKLFKSGSVEIEKLGVFQISDENNIVFSPNLLSNFSSNSFGLESFSKNPILSVVPKSETPVSSSLNSFIRYAAIFIFTLGIGYFSYETYNGFINNERLKNIAIAQDKILENVQSATFNIGQLPKINLNVSPPKLNEDRTYYSVIAGAFRSKINAQQHLNDLINKGYQASYTSINPKGLFRVAYGRLESREQALSLISEIRLKGEDAWLLIEN